MASSQTYYDFASEEITGMSSYSIIRAVKSSEAVAYYETATGNKLVLVDMNLIVKEIDLPQNMFVRDIRVAGTEIYFCGSMMSNPYMNKNNGFIAHVSYNDFANNANVDLTYDIYDTTYCSIFTRLVAYNETATGGMDKIVAVGERLFPSVSGTPCIGMSSYGPYLCSQRIVLECDFDINAVPQNFYNRDVRYSNEPTHLEYIDEVIETGHYIAIIGYDKDENAISIHPCLKGLSILSSFDTYYYYPGTMDDGQSLFHGCSMFKDTIAIASLALNTPTPVHLFETRIRTFDLVSKNMTTSQAIYLGNDKTEPIELVYMPNYQKLVMLMYFQFPLSQYNYTFLHLKPYSILVPYSAKGIYETFSSRSYYSVDRLIPTHYISTGGDYWFMKDVTIDATSKNCYKVGEAEVYNVDKASHIKKYHYYMPFFPSWSPQ